MRFEVPQFIDIEDKIFGPLTWKQFLYLGGGIGMGVALFLMTNFIFILIGLPLIGIALALAFFPVNGRPFSFFLEAFFGFIGSTKLYLWRRKENIIYKNGFTPQAIKDPAQNTSASNTGNTVPNPDSANPAKDIGSIMKRLELEVIQKKE